MTLPAAASVSGASISIKKTDASGNASIDATLSVAVPVGRYISATATRSDSVIGEA